VNLLEAVLPCSSATCVAENVKLKRSLGLSVYIFRPIDHILEAVEPDVIWLFSANILTSTSWVDCHADRRPL